MPRETCGARLCGRASCAVCHFSGTHSQNVIDLDGSSELERGVCTVSLKEVGEIPLAPLIRVHSSHR